VIFLIPYTAPAWLGFSIRDNNTHLPTEEPLTGGSSFQLTYRPEAWSQESGRRGRVTHTHRLRATRQPAAVLSSAMSRTWAIIG